MPLFMLKTEYYRFYERGLKDVELRDSKPQWRNAEVGDMAVLQSGRPRTMRRTIEGIKSVCSSMRRLRLSAIAVR